MQEANKCYSQAEILAFHETHFSKFATDHFRAHFLQPEHPTAENQTFDAADEEFYEEEDDGLGYYPDGVKRTLTDEQIAIFRHSELEALRRARESSNTKKEEDSAYDMSDGEVSSSAPVATSKKNQEAKAWQEQKQKEQRGRADRSAQANMGRGGQGSCLSRLRRGRNRTGRGQPDTATPHLI